MDIEKRMIIKFGKALTALENGAKVGRIMADIKRDMVLLRFELAAELMPKVLKRVLEARGAAPVLPKDTVRLAVAGGLVAENNAIVLLEIIDSRNRMVHDYSESFANELYQKIISKYILAFKDLEKSLSRFESKNPNDKAMMAVSKADREPTLRGNLDKLANQK